MGVILIIVLEYIGDSIGVILDGWGGCCSELKFSQALGFRVLGFRLLGLRVRVLDFLGVRLSGLAFKVWG